MPVLLPCTLFFQAQQCVSHCRPFLSLAVDGLGRPSMAVSRYGRQPGARDSTIVVWYTQSEIK